MLIIQSPYDEWGIGYLVEAKCLDNEHPPYSLSDCNKTALADIEKYRQFSIEAMYKIKGGRKHIGAWGPACVQHGFIDENSFKSNKFVVPVDTGMELYEAVNKFLKNPENAPWLLDEGQWPTNNTGCNGVKTSNLVSE